MEIKLYRIYLNFYESKVLILTKEDNNWYSGIFLHITFQSDGDLTYPKYYFNVNIPHSGQSCLVKEVT